MLVPDVGEEYHDFLVIGAGICGIYQLIKLHDLEADVLVLEKNADVGGTWFNNRYPGCRFDSESYSYGLSFSREVLEEWDWTEHFSPQPETLRYLNYLTEKFDLRKDIQFDCKVSAMRWDEASRTWSVLLDDGRSYRSRFVITAIGLISIPTPPRYPGMERFRGPSFHTFDWPHDPPSLEGKRVAVIGTGATGVQIIPAIADQVAELYVYQRRPNWCAPLHNRKISPHEMEDIRASYDEIFGKCAKTPGGFIHGPDPRSFFEVPAEERGVFWERLYNSPGFEKWIGNFREVLMDEAANAEFSEFVANKIRERVKDPVLAEKLIPKDHGFGVQRVPLETQYYETYNRENVHLVEIEETPIVEITEKGIRTSDCEREFDIIVYATGFDAITGAFDRIDIRGVGNQSLRELWSDDPQTYLGVFVHGFPNMVMLAGPQGASNSTNFPRAIETAVNWASDLYEYILEHGYTRMEATAESQHAWVEEVRKLYSMLLLRKAKSWFTGYNENIEGRNKTRYLIYNGGAPRYRKTLREVAAGGYGGVEFS
jgi:cation diffusion facilitator CzcD-associated flavoprotein CzcO